MTTTIKRAVDIYKQTVKDDDFLWWRYASRPFAALFLSLFHKKPWTPNQLSVASLVVGMVSNACYAFYLGTVGLWVAWVVGQLAFIIDCMDGMKARYYKMFSPVGAKFEFLTDGIKALFLFPAVGYRLYSETGAMWPLWLGLVGVPIVASGLSMTVFTRSPEYSGKSEWGKEGRPDGLWGIALRIFSFLGNYPSWIIIPVIFQRMDLFLVISIAVYTLHAGYTSLGILAKVCVPAHYERPPSADERDVAVVSSSSVEKK